MGYQLRILLLSTMLCASLSSFAAKDKMPVVFAKKIALIELNEVLTYPARVEPKIHAAVVAEADGVVTEIRAPLGRRVQKNTPLLVVRNTDPVYQYSPMVITSPVHGVVSQVEVTVGSRVARGDKLLLVTDPEQIRVIVEIAASDIRSVRNGMTADLELPGEPEHLKVKVKGVSPFVDPGTGTATCELELSKKQPLSPGLIGKVVFKVNQRQGFSIPDSALTYRGKDPFVRVVTDGKAKLTAVSLGRKQAGFVEIVKGLKAGDQVIERTSGFVADGEAVQVQAGDGTQG